MTHTETHATDRLAKQRLYRRLMVGFILGGVAVALVLRDLLGYPLVGEAVYWLGIVAFFAVWWLSPVTLFDERDWALERHASQLTIYVVGAVLVVGATVGRVLPKVSSYALPEAVGHALYAYVSVFVVWALAYGYLRYRP